MPTRGSRPGSRRNRSAPNSAGERSTGLQRLIVGVSPAVRSLRREIGKLAGCGVRSVLVQGESGVGKDLVARGLHLCAGDPTRPLEIFNCPAVPADHLESELFGTTRGAYPGAVDRPGAVERADGGLLVLDEIGATPTAHQAKLLRLLENGEARRLGGRASYRVHVQVVAATNEELRAAVDDGRFRRDLYYRLVQDAVLHIPPLRTRPEDVAPLAEHFLAELEPRCSLAPAALARLRGERWPGNVRELRAVLRSAAHLAEGLWIAPDDVDEALQRIVGQGAGARGVVGPPPAAAGPGEPEDFHALTATLRRQLLIEALRTAGGNRTRAGVLLGLHRRRSGREAAEEGVEGGVGLAARKRAHRKFDYWWRRLVEPGRPN